MSGANDVSEIENFIAEQFSFVEEDGDVSIVSLVHHAHTGEADILSMKTGHAKWKNAKEMAHSFDAFASRHARGIVGGGAQQYSIAVVRGQKSRPSTTLPFVRFSPSHVGVGPTGSIATEPPTELGQRMQHMRHTEGLAQGFLDGSNHLRVAQQTALDRAYAKIESSEKTNSELWLACKTLLMELDQTRHAHRMQEIAAARMAEFQRHLMALAPALVNMMTGKELFPLSSADTNLIEGIAAGVSPEQMQSLAAFLATQQGGDKISSILLDRYKRYQDKIAMVESAEKRLLTELPGRTYDEAERDAAGEAVRSLLKEGGIPSKSFHAKTNGTNGTTNGHATTARVVDAPGGSVATPAADTQLWDKLFATVPETQFEMLVSALAGNNPELAQELRARHAVSKKDQP